jgi:hypothetical protein
MEYLRGPSLAAYLRELNLRNENLPPEQVARLLSMLATALDYAHEQGVIHRDVKPANIILHTKTGQFSSDQLLTLLSEPVITDFGLVRIAHATTQTSSGKLSGTPAYMSPEQAHGSRVDHRSDIYSLGIVLYELIAGHVPFEADSSWAVIYKHASAAPPPIPGIQLSVQKVIDRVLAKDPDMRYQTCRELAADYMDAIGMVSEANTLRMETALPGTRQPEPVTASEKRDRLAGSGWKQIAAYLSAGILIIALAVWGITRFSSLGGAANDPSAVPPAEAALGLLRFQDGTAPADKVTISTSSMELPPQGKRYEAWLIADDGEQRISIGTIEFDEQRHGSLTFVDGEGRNLLGRYSTLEITTEPDPDPSTNSSNLVVFLTLCERFTTCDTCYFCLVPRPNKSVLLRPGCCTIQSTKFPAVLDSRLVMSLLSAC